MSSRRHRPRTGDYIPKHGLQERCRTPTQLQKYSSHEYHVQSSGVAPNRNVSSWNLPSDDQVGFCARATSAAHDYYLEEFDIPQKDNVQIQSSTLEEWLRLSVVEHPDRSPRRVSAVLNKALGIIRNIQEGSLALSKRLRDSAYQDCFVDTTGLRRGLELFLTAGGSKDGAQDKLLHFLLREFSVLKAIQDKENPMKVCSLVQNNPRSEYLWQLVWFYCLSRSVESGSLTENYEEQDMCEGGNWLRTHPGN